MPEPLEIEGKFACEPEDLERLLALDRIGDFRLIERDERIQTDTYFDTPSLALRGASSSLRLREIGSAVKATFKGARQAVSAVSAESHLIQRLELEVPVVPAPADHEAFLARLDLAPVARARELAGTAELRPIARLVTFRRMLHYARSNGETVELSLDTVDALDLRDNRATQIVEVELELTQGTAATLIAAATALNAAIPTLRPSHASKLARTLGDA